MSNHANRSKKTAKAGREPKAADVTRARAQAGLTQSEAAELIHVSPGAWQNWEQDLRTMPASAFEYFLLRTGQYRVEPLQVPSDPDALPMLRLRAEDGRAIDLKIQPEELARLSRAVTPHVGAKSANRLADLQTEEK